MTVSGGMAVEVRGIRQRFGGVTALDDVSLSVEPGELRAVIGPNGAGKSTLFNVIAGEQSPSAGRLLLDEQDVTAMPAHLRTKLGVVRTFQVTRVFPAMTVLDNAVVAVLADSAGSRCFWRTVTKKERIRAEDALDAVGMRGLRRESAAALSQGDRKRLEIAGALALSPRLLLLDEPTAGMSPEETQSAIVLIEQLWERYRMTVLLTEHDIAMVFRLAERITVLHRGNVLCTDEPEMIRNRADVRDIYLGRE